MFEDVKDFVGQHGSHAVDGFVAVKSLLHQRLDGLSGFLRLADCDLVLEGLMNGDVQNGIGPVALDLLVG